MGQAVSYLTYTLRRCCKKNTLTTESGEVIELDDEHYDTVDLDDLRCSDPLMQPKFVLLKNGRKGKRNREYDNDHEKYVMMFNKE